MIIGFKLMTSANTGTVLYQLSYQANWELVTFLVCNIPIEGVECK